MTDQLSGEAARQSADYIASWLAFRRHYLRVPGVQAAIVDADGIVTQIADGSADLERDVAMTPRHLFRIASHSKTFTATVIMQLVEQGVLRLDDPVSSYLSWLADGPLASVSLRELLSHSSGLIRDGRTADWWQLSTAFPDDDQLRTLATEDATLLEASERFKYSNVGFSLLGSVIAAATGASYNDEVRARVINRLGLADTDPEYNPDRSKDYAVGYSSLGYADRRIPIEHVDTRAMSAATGFSSTATDVCRYAAAHFDGDERLLSDHAKRTMRHPGWDIAGSENRYGLGFESSEVAGVNMIGHGGGYPGHSTRTLIDPAGQVAVSVLTNAIDGPAATLADGVVKIIAAAGREPAEDERFELTEVEVDRFCGRYASLWGVFDLVRLGRRLLLISPTADDPLDSPSVVVPDGPDQLKVVRAGGYGGYAERLAFTFAEDGTVVSVSGPSGITQWPIAAVSALVGDRDQVRVGTLPPAALPGS